MKSIAIALLLLSLVQTAQGQEMGGSRPVTELRLMVQIDLKNDGTVEFVLNGIPDEWLGGLNEEFPGKILIKELSDHVDDPILNRELFVMKGHTFETTEDMPSFKMELGESSTFNTELGQAVTVSKMQNINFIVGRVADFKALKKVAEWVKVKAAP